jgi:cytochrome c553
MRKMKTAWVMLAVALAGASGGCATVERSRNLHNAAVPGRTLAEQVCSNCHGLDGNSVSPNFPRLAGQSSAYLVSQLRQFRSHGRSDPAGFTYMWGLSRGLADAQIDELAKYFAGQAATPNAPGDTRLTERGRSIFEKGIPGFEVPPCFACHGPRGLGTEVYPRLAGQHADYVVKQLVVFQGTDERPEGAVMKTVSHLLTRQDMRAVADYVQGLR